jgi:flagellar motor switch protein FliM
VADVLSQDEIQALLSAMGGDDAAAEPAVSAPAATTAPATAAAKSRATTVAKTPAAAPAGGAIAAARARRPSFAAPLYQPYDFRRPDKFSKDQMRTLQMIHEAFARMYASSLSAYLPLA